MELCSHSWVDCLVADLFLNSCFSDTVFVTLFCTGVETAVSRVRKLDHTSWQGPLCNSVVLVVADGLFSLCGLEHMDQLFIGTRPPP